MAFAPAVIFFSHLFPSRSSHFTALIFPPRLRYHFLRYKRGGNLRSVMRVDNLGSDRVMSGTFGPLDKNKEGWNETVGLLMECCHNNHIRGKEQFKSKVFLSFLPRPISLSAFFSFIRSFQGR